MRVEFVVNNEKVISDINDGEFLLDTLRHLGYMSVKKGCDTGSCGLCTVWVDNKPVLSCSMLTARVQGKTVTTIEGIKEKAESFAKFLVNEGAEQCGYCSPGFIMTVLAMENELVNPSEEDILHYLTGNLCRCTGYEGQLRAIKKYLRRTDDEIC